MAALEAHPASQFAILLVEGITLSYRAVYAHVGEELVRIVGKGPTRLREEHAEKLYKYSSTGRKFVELAGRSSFKTSTDAISVDPKRLRKAAAQMKAARQASQARPAIK